MPASDHAPLIDLGCRRYSMEDQLSFAALSHDANPMHVDPVAARRLLTGRCVVHGMHLLLDALERRQGESLVGSSIECTFAQPVSVGDTAHFSQTTTSHGDQLLRITVDDVVCARFEIAPATRPVATAAGTAAEGRTLQPRAEPIDASPDSLLGQILSLEEWAPAAPTRFPQAARQIGAAGVQAIAGLSYVVGMECPGLHSVYSSLRIDHIATGHTGAQQVLVRSFEPRFQMVTLALNGLLQGEIQAFVRARPQPQPSAQEVAEAVTAQTLKGRHALVIGGSRGLGELAAKLLAASGADVTISYASGGDDAEAIAHDINNLGRGHCRAVRWNLTEGDPATALSALPTPDLVMFFATPRIFRKTSALFDRQSFDLFTDFYLDRFAALCQALDTPGRSRKVHVFLPSSTFIEDRPKGMTAYAMAKAAAEILATDLSRQLRQVRVHTQRLPRLATDQTAGVHGLSARANLEVLTAALSTLVDHVAVDDKPA